MVYYERTALMETSRCPEAVQRARSWCKARPNWIPNIPPELSWRTFGVTNKQ
jgi:hypothetical protein